MQDTLLISLTSEEELFLREPNGNTGARRFVRLTFYVRVNFNPIGMFGVPKCTCAKVENSLLGQRSSVPRLISKSSSRHVTADRNKSFYSLYKAFVPI